MEEKQNNIDQVFSFINKYKIIIFIFIILLCTSIVFFIDDIEICIFRNLIGFPCLGCGMTRAIRYAMVFDFTNAFAYHPLFFIVPIIILLFMFYRIKVVNKLLKNKYFWISIFLLFLIVYLMRMVATFPNEVLNYNKKSLLYLIIELFQ